MYHQNITIQQNVTSYRISLYTQYNMCFEMVKIVQKAKKRYRSLVCTFQDVIYIHNSNGILPVFQKKEMQTKPPPSHQNHKKNYLMEL